MLRRSVGARGHRPRGGGGARRRGAAARGEGRARRPRGCLLGATAPVGSPARGLRPRQPVPARPRRRRRVTYCFSPCPGPRWCMAVAGAACFQGAGAGWGGSGASGQPPRPGSAAPRSLPGDAGTRKGGEHVPVSSSAVPLAPGRGYGLRGSGEGRWDGHPATLKQSEQKRWDETGRPVHGMKPSSPAGSAARPPRHSLLTPAPRRRAAPPDQRRPSRGGGRSSGAQHWSGTSAASKPSPWATVPPTVLGGERCLPESPVPPPGERSTRLKPQPRPRQRRCQRGTPAPKGERETGKVGVTCAGEHGRGAAASLEPIHDLLTPETQLRKSGKGTSSGGLGKDVCQRESALFWAGEGSRAGGKEGREGGKRSPGSRSRPFPSKGARRAAATSPAPRTGGPAASAPLQRVGRVPAARWGQRGRAAAGVWAQEPGWLWQRGLCRAGARALADAC